MTDRRRSRWIAFDASFYDDALGVMIRERFGPVGLVLFSAFLCACKRNVTQGRIVYGSEADALAQMGLPDLELTNERGEPFTLQTFFKSLGHHKQTSTTRRGRLTYVEATKWRKWQKEYGNQVEAERKGRPRPTNTPADVPQIPGEFSADAPPIESTNSPETDLDLDLDLETDLDLDSEPVEGEEEFHIKVSKAARLVADHRLAKRKGGDPVRLPEKWLAAAALEVLGDMRHLARSYPNADAEWLAKKHENGSRPSEAVPLSHDPYVHQAQ